ncbi:MAG TPA: hypothetical protein ENI87_01805 [bacterium]|nr:hypothetical protein [bacterium]
MTVVEFPRRDPLIWVCACGGSSFHIYDTGEVECLLCGRMAHGGEIVGNWAVPARPDPDEPVPETAPLKTRVCDEVVLEARKALFGLAEALAVVVLADGGRIRVFYHQPKDGDQRAWYRERMALATEMIVEKED